MRFFMVLLSCMMLSGCAKQLFLYPYQSGADIPKESRSLVSQLSYIPIEDEPLLTRAYGVFAGFDDPETSYLLITIRYSRRSSNGLTPVQYYDILNGSDLDRGKAEEFIAVLRRCEQAWNSEPQFTDANYIEYKVTPEHKVTQLSDHVVALEPALNFRFQSTHKGPVASMKVGLGIGSKVIWFDELEEVNIFRTNLEQALDALEGLSGAQVAHSQ